MKPSSLREFYDSPKAFHPFRIHLTSGKTLEIEHRENVLFSNEPDTIIVVPRAGHEFSIVSVSEIAEIISLPKPGSKRSQKSS